MERSNLHDTLELVTNRAATAVVARARLSSAALNTALLRRLSSPPGTTDSLLADPILEVARVWKPSELSLGDLAGNLLEERLVNALDTATAERLGRDLHPYAHQIVLAHALRFRIEARNL